VGGVGTHPVVYPNGDICEYLNVWFRCRAIGGETEGYDDESLEVAWFDPDNLPELDGWAKLRIETTCDTDGPAWHAGPGERHPALTQPDAI
jgi:8-oxo-dGTP diphosphatase